MSTRDQLSLIHELESHGTLIICCDDDELAEVIRYEMKEGEEDDV